MYRHPTLFWISTTTTKFTNFVLLWLLHGWTNKNCKLMIQLSRPKVTCMCKGANFSWRYLNCTYVQVQMYTYVSTPSWTRHIIKDLVRARDSTPWASKGRPHTSKKTLVSKLSSESQGKIFLGLNMCLTLRSWVSRWGPSFLWLKPFVFNSNPKQRFCKA